MDASEQIGKMSQNIIAAQILYTIKDGPDRIAGFTPIPAMSMISYASGARFINLLGGEMLSFYDWYADLPPASPQIWVSKQTCQNPVIGTMLHTL